MHIFLLTLWLLVVTQAGAADVLPRLTAGSQTYTNVTVTSVTATDVFFTHAGGMGNVKLKLLSPQLQKQFNFDHAKAASVEQRQAENKTNYVRQLQKSTPALTINSGPNPPPAPGTMKRALWRPDFAGTLKQARSEGKLVLVNFTGSDWCPACKHLEKNVLSTGEFAEFAEKKLELVKADFPRHAAQSAEQSRANQTLAKRYLIQAYPTLVLVDAEGKELWNHTGSFNDAAPLIRELQTFTR